MCNFFLQVYKHLQFSLQVNYKDPTKFASSVLMAAISVKGKADQYD